MTMTTKSLVGGSKLKNNFCVVFLLENSLKNREIKNR